VANAEVIEMHHFEPSVSAKVLDLPQLPRSAKRVFNQRPFLSLVDSGQFLGSYHASPTTSHFSSVIESKKFVSDPLTSQVSKSH